VCHRARRAFESLAWISFTAPGQPADLITVSIDGVRKLMDDGRWGNLRLATSPGSTGSSS